MDTENTEKSTKVRKSFKNIGKEGRYTILLDYISLKKSIGEIAEEHKVARGTIESFISEFYKRFRQARETNILVSTQNNGDLYQVLKARNVDGEHINKIFLNKLSNDESLVLSEAELLFAEFHLELGDDIKAIEKAKLNLGLSKNENNIGQYKEACLLRAFYLKRKPNVASHINNMKKERLKQLDSGKAFLQENLMTIIEQIRNSNDPRKMPSMLKALEQLGRTMGAFDDKLTVNNVDADKALDAMLARAKKINEKEEE